MSAVPWLSPASSIGQVAGTASLPFARLDPHRDVGGLERLLHGTGQVGPHRVRSTASCSCWRRSPDERRQLATWPAGDATQHSTPSRKNASWTAFHHPAAGSVPVSWSRFPPESTCVRWPMIALAVMMAAPTVYSRPTPA